MKKSCLLIVFAMYLFFTTTTAVASSGWIVFHESAFEGKVIDAETFEPIEGAVVAAIYKVAVYGFGHSGSGKADVQETLTDSNGEFHIPGNFFFQGPFSLGSPTTFIIFKPGYGAYSGNYSFFIYPVLRKIRKDSLKDNILGDVPGTVIYPTSSTAKNEDFAEYYKNKYMEGMEGIVFEKVMTDKEEWNLYDKKFGANWSPFIPLKNPFEKVRNLDLPFDTDVMRAEKILTFLREPFKTYPVIGLPKLKTRDERRSSHSCANRIPDGFENKVPIWKKMLDDEYNFITKGVR